MGEVVGAVHAILLAAVAVAFSGQQVAATPPRQGHEPLMLKQLLLCHIHAAATFALQQGGVVCTIGILLKHAATAAEHRVTKCNTHSLFKAWQGHT